MKTPNNLCFKTSPKNKNYIKLIKEIHRVDLKNFYSIKFIIPTNNLNIKRGISKKNYFYRIGNKGLNFFSGIKKLGSILKKKVFKKDKICLENKENNFRNNL
jgi:hypothetical protein